MFLLLFASDAPQSNSSASAAATTLHVTTPGSFKPIIVVEKNGAELLLQELTTRKLMRPLPGQDLSPLIAMLPVHQQALLRKRKEETGSTKPSGDPVLAALYQQYEAAVRKDAPNEDTTDTHSTK